MDQIYYEDNSKSPYNRSISKKKKKSPYNQSKPLNYLRNELIAQFIDFTRTKIGAFVHALKAWIGGDTSGLDP